MTSSAPTPEFRQRVRCHQVHTAVTPDSRCRIRVEVEWTGGTIFQGEGEGNDTPEGQVRAAARATLAAVEEVAEGALDLELRGVKVIRVFDRQVVIVALRGRGEDRRYDLMGSTAAPEGDLAQGAVLAVLDATNRVLEKYVQQPGPSSDPDSASRDE